MTIASQQLASRRGGIDDGPLRDGSVFDLHYHIGDHERACPVSDHNDGAVPRVLCDRLVNQPLAFDVDLARGLVHHEDLGVAKEGPR